MQGLFAVHNQFIYFVWNFQANDVNAQFMFLFYQCRDTLSLFDRYKTNLT